MGLAPRRPSSTYDLCAEIVPTESAIVWHFLQFSPIFKVLINEKKVESILKLQQRHAWTRLCYEGEGDADGACLVEDGDGGTCYAVY